MLLNQAIQQTAKLKYRPQIHWAKIILEANIIDNAFYGESNDFNRSLSLYSSCWFGQIHSSEYMAGFGTIDVCTSASHYHT